MDKVSSQIKELDIESIDYIGIKITKLIKPKYSIVISYNFNEINIVSTETTDEIKIVKLLEEIKEQFKNNDNFISIDKYSPLINILRAKDVELMKCRFINKNYLKITLCNGDVCLTKQEPFKAGQLNKWQICCYKYWSRRNDHIHGK